MRLALFTFIIICLSTSVVSALDSNHIKVKFQCPSTDYRLTQVPDSDYPDMSEYDERHFITKCRYENGVELFPYWGENQSTKHKACNFDWFKENVVKDQYNVVDKTAPPYVGIGAMITLREGKIVVENFMPNSAAEGAGVQLGDEIAVINGEPTKGFSVEEAVARLRGDVDASLSLKIHRPDSFEYLDITLIRNKILSKELEFDIFSPTRFAYNKVTIPRRVGYEDEDQEYWVTQAIEHLKKIEEAAVPCIKFKASSKGPTAVIK